MVLRIDVDVTKADGLPRSTVTGSLRASHEHKSATQIVIARRYDMATRIKKSYSGQELRAGSELIYSILDHCPRSAVLNQAVVPDSLSRTFPL